MPDKRESGYYWVRIIFRHSSTSPVMAFWDKNRWIYNCPLNEDDVEVIYGPIPGPEELQRMSAGDAKGGAQ